jgi:nicotinamide mononucleotide transporter
MLNLSRLFNTQQFGVWFLFIGVILQIISYVITGSSWISLISGITGIISVVLCAQRKISFYLFGYIQLVTYCILAYQQNFYGELIENVFYAITMVYGLIIWFRHKDIKDTRKVESRELSKHQFNWVKITCIIGIILLYYILRNTNDTQPFLDSVTTIPAFIAQILMILAYREQWYFWLIIDIASIWMWAVVGDWCMASQFVFWTINCLYGLHKWNVKENFRK